MAEERVCDLSGCSGPLMDAVHEHILTSGCVDALKVRLAAAERERDEALAKIGTWHLTQAEDSLFRIRHSLKEIHDSMMASAESKAHTHEPIPGMREGSEYASCMGLMTEVLLLKGRAAGLREAAEVCAERAAFHATPAGAFEERDYEEAAAAGARGCEAGIRALAAPGGAGEVSDG